MEKVTFLLSLERWVWRQIGAPQQTSIGLMQG